MAKFLKLYSIFVIFFLSVPLPADEVNPSEGIDFDAIEKALSEEGVEGWIHAAVPAQGLYLFTFRSPDDFFTNAQFPLVSHIPDVADQLPKLKRHDKVKIKGKFIQNGAPQRHIYVTQLKVLDPFDANTELPPYQYSVKIPDDLKNKTELIAKVHAVDANGKVLVIDYKGSILPVFVEDTKVSETLYRGDKIRLKYKLRIHPNRPTHLSPNTNLENPIEILKRLVDRHGQEETLTGALVRFPKSPQVAFDVYALQVADPDGFVLDHTLVNFDDSELFFAILEKAKTAWFKDTSAVINGRNKEINPKITVKAKGTINVVSPSQANPQIVISDLKDLQIN